MYALRNALHAVYEYFEAPRTQESQYGSGLIWLTYASSIFVAWREVVLKYPSIPKLVSSVYQFTPENGT